ncbi:hypothetical protein TRAPUB_7573 [Trametes pubescens]|uniref:Fungal-type protein kinase domain-containing protein n=1 Tax=Trametes pubescens TaxID=154538 RepID=A0A1M2V2U0_TRAPU|nr:hypothetical protein TRAPUB_7573 [Trametes pubescens]
MAMGGKTTLVTSDEFLTEFVPKPAGIKTASLSSILSSLPKESSEYNMYHPLMNALNGATRLCPGFTFVATPTKGDKASARNHAVYCGLYPSAHAPHPQYDDEGEPIGSPAVDWSRIAIPIEVKSTANKDPFDDNKPDGQPVALEKQKSLGQILAYAQYMLDHQHLTFLFMIVIIQEDARLLRIDRSGIFVTKKFNYKTSSDPLMEFLWRFARLSPELQGQDHTAERIDYTSDHADTMRTKLKTAPDDYVRALFKTSLDEKWAWWLLKLTDERTKKVRRFLVGKPHFRSQGVAGRGTRGYVALDADDTTAPFVYLKDSWRVVHDEIQKEGAVLTTLNAKKVSYVPTLLCHGDLGQITTSEQLWRKYHKNHKKDTPYPLKQHIHYRLVVKQVGKPLSDFKDGCQLVSALVCCLIAHAQAYKVGLIHRDISAGNILLYPYKDGE